MTFISQIKERTIKTLFVLRLILVKLPICTFIYGKSNEIKQFGCDIDANEGDHKRHRENLLFPGCD